MEPARDPHRDEAQRELEDILREAEELRDALRPPGAAGAADRSREPRLELVPGGAPEPASELGPDGEPWRRVRILHEGEGLELVPPSPARSGLPFALRVAGAVAALLLAVALWAWLPSGPPILQPPLPRAAYVEASGRYALWLTARRIDRFVRVKRRLPATLAELGEPTPERIGYVRLPNGTYRLTAPGADGPIVLDQADALRPPGRETRVALRGEPR